MSEQQAFMAIGVVLVVAAILVAVVSVGVAVSSQRVAFHWKALAGEWSALAQLRGGNITRRFPIPGWFMESDTGPRQRLDTEAKDEGWVVVPRRRAVMYGYIAGTRPWSPGAMQVEIDRAAERRALKKALAQRRGR